MAKQTQLQQAQNALAARRLVEALLLFDEAQEHGADADACGGGRWQAAMLAGDFQTAWRESDLIRARGAVDPQRLWTGEPLAGKRVIVRCLRGFGDAVQMLAYARKLRQLAASVVWEVPPRLLELAPRFADVQEVMTWGDAAPAQPVHYDAQLEAMELPYIFRTRLEDLPVAQRYLRVAPLALAPALRPRVGLVWGAGSWNPQRGMDAAELAPLLAKDDVEWWNLQGGTHALPAGLATQAPQAPPTIQSLAETIAALDLVITVDTLAAHLAGALGKPVWLLLQHAADWRWMHARPDSSLATASPWYPTMRIFRQSRADDWGGVMEQVLLQIAKEQQHGFLGL